MTVEEMARLYRLGWSVKRIASLDDVCVTFWTVRRWLNAFGVEMRSPNHGRRRAHVDSAGYVKWGRKRVHRIVCRAWHGPPPTPKHEVNHIDGDKLNNHPENLEWVTHAENSRHAYRIGLTPKPPMHRGVEQHCAKLDPEKVAEIRSALRDGRAVPFMAKQYGVTNETVRRAARGRTWAHVTKVPAVGPEEWAALMGRSSREMAA